MSSTIIEDAVDAVLYYSSSDDLYECASTYGIQIIAFILLSAMAVYRREMSCNRVFHQDGIQNNEDDNDDDDNDEYSSSSNDLEGSADDSDDDEYERDEMLDAAGMYCSGAPFIALAQAWCERKRQKRLRRHASNVTRIDSNCCGGSTRPPAKVPTPETLFDCVEHYYSTEPFWAAAAWLAIKHARTQLQSMAGIKMPSSCPYSRRLPTDVHTHIASFLHPRDVVKLACVSRSYRGVIDRGEVSMAIWKTLWERDYGWVLSDMDIGKEAVKRSNALPAFSKQFYFRFGQTYLNYVLAGQNSPERCLVGLHSNIYDITPFLHLHPGSPDTLMVHSGKDATAFFEDMGHSMGARRLAKSLCIVVDRSGDHHRCGLYPTAKTAISPNATHHRISMFVENDRLCKSRKEQRRKRRIGTLSHIRERLEMEHLVATKKAEAIHASNSSILGDVNVHYDPIRQSWQAWYT
eukprot:CAMPEP_0119553166 /NCGR_PEP_ID=MMETSP1352-20130426/5978_1 /TAXON_ID=265584 /ORGANISM="Stauroneis constricta, Strain CCMP1120" /LENGTH=462 /DNA_ID=CAMNT_0007599521 /DNA_START=335 /DNA_END=1719 /DNA_ORIENTATION=+